MMGLHMHWHNLPHNHLHLGYKSLYTVHTSQAQVQLNLKPICDFVLHKACHNPQSSLMQNRTMQDKGSAIIHYYPTSMHCNDTQTMVETVRGWFQVYTLTHMSTL